MESKNQKFDISSVGLLYRKSLELFATCLEDMHGHTITLDMVDIGQKFYVIFPSGTGLTRTSGKRIC